MQQSASVIKSVTRLLSKKNELAKSMKINFCAFYNLKSSRCHKLTENLWERLTTSVKNFSATDSF